MPRLHAFIVGVDHYRYLDGGVEAQPDSYGMGQLTSAVATAMSIYQWLTANGKSMAAPLATCRLLLSPGQGARGIPGMRSATASNFLATVAEWRDEASKDPDDYTFFYFVGHGIQRGEADAVLLMEDFNQPGGGRLRNAVDTNSIVLGMSPSQPGRASIARTQVYCVDACRIEVEQFMRLKKSQTAEAFDIEPGSGAYDDRSAPFCYGALPGTMANAIPGGLTFFSQALLRSLESAAVPMPEELPGRQWPVTVRALSGVLQSEMEEVRRAQGGAQDYYPTGPWKEATLRFLPTAPAVPIRLQIDPETACDAAKLDIVDTNAISRLSCGVPVAPHPVNISLPMGIYTTSVTFSPPHADYLDRTVVKQIGPGRSLLAIKVMKP